MVLRRARGELDSPRLAHRPQRSTRRHRRFRTRDGLVALFADPVSRNHHVFKALVLARSAGGRLRDSCRRRRWRGVVARPDRAGAAGRDRARALAQASGRFSGRVVFRHPRAEFELRSLDDPTIAEHRMYLPLAAPIIAAVLALSIWLNRRIGWAAALLAVA